MSAAKQRWMGHTFAADECTAKWHRKALTDTKTACQDFEFMGLDELDRAAYMCKRCRRIIIAGGETPPEAA